MSEEKQPQRLVEFDRLNLLGKAVYAGGAAVRIAANAIEAAIDRTADVLADAERAFRQGMDDNIDDATILDETRRETRRGR